MSAILASFDERMAAAWVMGWLTRALLYGTLLAGLTWLLSRIAPRRLSPTVQTVLWSIVLIKFLMPVGPSWSHSLANLWENVSRSAPTRSAETESPEAVLLPATLLQADVPAEQAVHQLTVRRPRDWTVPIAGAYLAAIVALTVVRMRSYRALQARCRKLPRANESTRRLVARVCKCTGVRRIPATLVDDRPPAPFVMGVFRPTLVLARRHLVRPDELETVIVHEVAHLRRGDVFVRLLQRIAGTLLFFWPIVAWVNRRLETVREHACDQWALRHGKLSAGQYARCLLNVARPRHAHRLAYHPACMATNYSTIERRIDVILESPTRCSRKPAWGLPTVAFLLVWGVFVLAGAADPTSAKGQAWADTELAVKEHAIQTYNLVAEHEVADFNADGVLSYLEKDTYLVALAMQNPAPFMEEFPYADRNHSERLDFLEVYGVIRGITRIAYLDRRISAEIETVPDRQSADGRQQVEEIKARYAPASLQLLHEALDAQQWLIENMTSEPSPHDLDNIWSVLKRTQGSPRMYSLRMLNHGGPTPSVRVPKHERGELSRFHELESQIAQIEARLAIEADAEEAARLKIMLAKLENILAELETP
jgi:beta-lactamase regulating signal transducer with metallopeptidase domain